MIRLVDVHGNTAAYYRYDPYGKVIEASGSRANINPLRYRGYVYDSETGLYYLQSRYYDPQVGRFINADTLVSTGQGLPAIHHVVPQGCLCQSAVKAREILGNEKNLISVQDPINLVIINYETHKQLHSSKHGYCDSVYAILSANKNDARGGLMLIKLGIMIIALSNGSYYIGIW